MAATEYNLLNTRAMGQGGGSGIEGRGFGFRSKSIAPYFPDLMPLMSFSVRTKVVGTNVAAPKQLAQPSNGGGMV